jgi:hypothetical protein
MIIRLSDQMATARVGHTVMPVKKKLSTIKWEGSAVLFDVPAALSHDGNSFQEPLQVGRGFTSPPIPY